SVEEGHQLSFRWRCYSIRYRATASSFQFTPLPGMAGGVTMPFTTGNGSANIAEAQSTYSSQCAVGLTASKAELTSGKRCEDNGICTAETSDAARSHPLTPPMRIASGIM